MAAVIITVHPSAAGLRRRLITYYYTVSADVLLCSLADPDPRVGHTVDVLSPFHLSPSSVIHIDSSTGSPVLSLSIQAVRGLPRLRAPGIVPCIISFLGQLPCFLMG